MLTWMPPKGRHLRSFLAKCWPTLIRHSKRSASKRDTGRKEVSLPNDARRRKDPPSSMTNTLTRRQRSLACGLRLMPSSTA